MTLQDVVGCLTKYYRVVIVNDQTCYEDQTVIPKSRLCRNVSTIDFYEDCGEGEMLLIYLSDR